MNIIYPNNNINKYKYIYPNVSKIRVTVGPKTNYFSYILISCSNRIPVFNNFFSLICSQSRDKENRVRDFFLSKYFLNNLLLTVFMQNTLSKLVELVVIIRKNADMVLCSSLLEMCVESLKLMS